MPEKYARVCEQIRELFETSIIHKYWDMHLMETIRGKLISWIIVITDMKIYIRELNEAISRAYEKDDFALSTNELQDLHIQKELEVWLQLKPEDLKRKWLQDSHVVAQLKSYTISTDASGFAAGLAYGPQRDLKFRTFTWNLSEYGYRIHYKVRNIKIERMILNYCFRSYGPLRKDFIPLVKNYEIRALNACVTTLLW